MEMYRGRRLKAIARQRRDGRWDVGVEIFPADGDTRPVTFSADDGIAYLLEEEALKEGVNLGRNLIDRGFV